MKTHLQINIEFDSLDPRREIGTLGTLSAESIVGAIADLLAEEAVKSGQPINLMSYASYGDMPKPKNITRKKSAAKTRKR